MNLQYKHADTISTLLFDIPNTTTTDYMNHNNHNSTSINYTMELPTCLLSKEQLQSESITEQCRSYYQLAVSIQSKPIIILLIRSGRFAGAVFQPSRNNHNNQNHSSFSCTHHRTSVRYTVRKGQGKAQSSQDGQGRKAISIGSQLRRQGEIQLRDDIRQTMIEWKEQFHNAAMILISVPRTMQKGLFFEPSNKNDPIILQRQDPRIRRIPLDIGRPTFEHACLIYHVLYTVTIRESNHVDHRNIVSSVTINNEFNMLSQIKEDDAKVNNTDVEKDDEEVIIPLSVLHIAAQIGDVGTLELLLGGDEIDVGIAAMMNQPAGIDQMTPLHYAAESAVSTTKSIDPNHAATCVRLLLEQGHANPCIVDKRRRVPYYLATSVNDKVRDAFRISRGILGEAYCDWDNDAKVGSPLSLEELNDKLEKEAEKRRKKRLKQKEKKAREKIEEQAAEERRLELEEQKMKDEEAKRIRDGLQPKLKSTTAGGKACDFCQTICVGKKRINMFQRLEYTYCTSICLQNHKRELVATAAMARMNPSATIS